MVENEKAFLNTQSELSMKGSGYYSKKTIGAKIAIDSLQHLIIDALNNISKSKNLRFADFGSADGGTSQELWYNLISIMRERGDHRPVEIIYTPRDVSLDWFGLLKDLVLDVFSKHK